MRISNIPSDIEKKVDNIYISLPFKELTSSNLLKNIQPTDLEIENKGSGLQIPIHPGDSDLDFRIRESKNGDIWSFSFDAFVFDNNRTNFNALHRFFNQKIVLFIGTTTHRYQVGWKGQPLKISFRVVNCFQNFVFLLGFVPTSIESL